MTTNQQYLADRRIMIEEMALSPDRALKVSQELETACADDIMDGCAAELLGMNLRNVTPECRTRALAIIAVARGERPSYGRLRDWTRWLLKKEYS